MPHLKGAWSGACKDFTSNFDRKFELRTLFDDAVRWCKKEGFEEDLPVRMLMAGVYEMIGHDQRLIGQFYAALCEALKKKFPGNGPMFIAEFERTRVVVQQRRGCYTFKEFERVEDLDANSVAFLMIKQLQDGFAPVAYKTASIASPNVNFPDCFETMTRNIVYAMLMREDGTLNSDVVIPELRLFFKKYPTMADQSLQEAHNDWAQWTVSKLFFEYARRRDHELKPTHELEPTFINVLAMLNHAFDLKVPELAVEFSRNDAEENQRWIASALPIVNARLQEKLGLPPEAVVISLNNPHSDDCRGGLSNCTIDLPMFSLQCMIAVRQHGEIQSVAPKKDKKFSEVTEKLQEQFPYLRTLLAKKPSRDMEPHQSVVFLSNSPTGMIYEMCSLLNKKGQASQALQNMLYAAIADNYDDRCVYLRHLGVCINSTILDNAFFVAVQACVRDQKDAVCLHAFDLLFTLLAKVRTYDAEVCAAAHAAIRDGNSVVRKQALEVLKMVEERHAEAEHSAPSPAIPGSAETRRTEIEAAA